VTRPYTFRPHAERARLAKSIVRLSKDETLTPTDIARALACSHVTVRKVQRAAGIYKPRGAGGKAP